MATTTTKYICKLCKNNLVTNDCLKIHLRICGKTKPLFNCNLCDQNFSSASHLLSHRYRCNKFICYQCDQVFVNSQALDYHIQTRHTRKTRRQYKCSLCDYLCNSRGDLYSHRLNQHGGADQPINIPDYILTHPNEALR